MVKAKQGAFFIMEFIKNKLRIFLPLIIMFVLFFRCKKEAEFQFCFSTMVNGSIDVSAIIGDVQVPCGALSSGGVPETNEGYDFEKEMDYCGKSASGYVMEIPDSAFLDWGFQKEGTSIDSVKHYKKRFKLPDFPKKKWDERYRIYFVIAYQDCVHCMIETIKK